MSQRLPSLKPREVCRALEKVGFVEVPGRGKGGHIFMHRTDPQAAVTIPSQGDVKRGTLRAIVRSAGLSVGEFLALL